jgi:hypothetical protein
MANMPHFRRSAFQPKTAIDADAESHSVAPRSPDVILKDFIDRPLIVSQWKN